jgi:hypothetical protein
MINTYGYKMTGLKAASARTKGLGPYDPFYVEVIYNMESGEIRTKEMLKNSYTRPDLPELRVWEATEPLSMQALADIISSAVDKYEELQAAYD